MIRKLFPQATLLLCALAFALSVTTASSQEGAAALRIAHMSPDAPLIDALIGRNLHLRDMAFGEVSTYVTLPAGDYEIRVFPHRLPLQQEAEARTQSSEQNEPEGSDGSLMLEPITIIATLQEGNYYTVVLSGFYEPPTQERQLGALSIDLTPENANLEVSGPRGYGVSLSGEQLLTNLEPGTYAVTASLEGYRTARYEVDLQPGTTTILTVSLQRSDVAEELPAATRQTMQTSQSPQVELHIYTDEFSAFPDAGRALVRLIHTAPITPALGAQAVPLAPDNGEPEGSGDVQALSQNLAFPNNSDYTALRGGSYRLEFNGFGTGQLLAELPLSLVPGGVYTIFLVADPMDGYLKVIPNVDAVITP